MICRLQRKGDKLFTKKVDFVRTREETTSYFEKVEKISKIKTSQNPEGDKIQRQTN
jgi:hypothetical protein